MKKRKLLTRLIPAGVAAAALAASALPASAQLPDIHVTLQAGRSSTDLPTVQGVPGIPALPGVGSQQGSGGSQGGAQSGGTAPVLNPPIQPTPKPTGPATTSPTAPDNTPGSPTSGSAQTTTNGTGAKGQVKGKTVSAPRLAPGVPNVPALMPTPANPTFTFALPNAAAIGVPDFFIQNFRVPIFLLQIFQAAGNQYNVPWQVLAGICEIESNYGQDLSVSSAGAEGWMQFLPSTWKIYGVDANQDGKKDPYNPADAIFAAARYLKAAGAETNLRGAIFQYNHSNAYVDSVLARAQLIGGLPDQFVTSLTGLTEGVFPVHAAATYADDALTTAKAKTAPGAPKMPMGTNIFAAPGSAIIAVQDGKVLRTGVSPSVGRFIQLQDSHGNVYTYSGLGDVATSYPVPKPQDVAPALISKISGASPATATADPAPAAPATGGVPVAAGPTAPAAATAVATGAPAPDNVLPPLPRAPADGATKDRLFASPARPAALAAGGQTQLDSRGAELPAGSQLSSYLTEAFGLKASDYVLAPLHTGTTLVAGTIVGHIAKLDPHVAPHILFQVRPAGAKAPLIDPKPILDGWKLKESTAIYTAAGKNPFLGPDAKDPTPGQVFLLGKEALIERTLSDPKISIYDCGRKDVAAGAVNTRVLDAINFLAASGLRVKVSALVCGHSAPTPPAPPAAVAAPAAGVAAPAAVTVGADDLASGNGADISAINDIAVKDHQGPASVTDIAIRKLLMLQGLYKPQQIISLMSYPGTDNTIALPDHGDRIHIGYTPQYSTDPRLKGKVDSILRPGQWIKLIDRLRQIPAPVIPSAPAAPPAG